MTRQRQLLIMALSEFLRNRPGRSLDDILRDIQEYFGATRVTCTYKSVDVTGATRLGTLLLDKPVYFSADLEGLPEYVTESYTAVHPTDQEELDNDSALEELDGDRG